MTTPLPPSPFIAEPVPFEFNEDRFMADIGVDPLPVFISDPSQSFLETTDYAAIADVLTKY